MQETRYDSQLPTKPRVFYVGGFGWVMPRLVAV